MVLKNRMRYQNCLTSLADPVFYFLFLFRSFLNIEQSQPMIPLKRAKNTAKADATANSTHLLLGVRSSIMHVEKILSKQGNVINNLASGLAEVKSMLEDRCEKSDTDVTIMPLSRANTEEELAALTVEFTVSITF